MKVFRKACDEIKFMIIELLYRKLRMDETAVR